MARKHEKELTNFILEELGAMLRAAREDQGLTRVEAAAKMGIDPEDITRIEQSLGDISIAQLQNYATFLGKTLQLKFL